jgi:BON domain
VRPQRIAGLFPFLPNKEEAMPVPNTACAERAAGPRPAPADLAERCLRSNPYLALKNVSCAWLDGVLVLRGCLPSYYLKQLAQEAVASLEGVGRIDNQIQVVTPCLPSRQG